MKRVLIILAPRQGRRSPRARRTIIRDGRDFAMSFFQTRLPATVHAALSFDTRSCCFLPGLMANDTDERRRVRWRECSPAGEVTRYLKRVILSPFAFFISFHRSPSLDFSLSRLSDSSAIRQRRRLRHPRPPQAGYRRQTRHSSLFPPAFYLLSEVTPADRGIRATFRPKLFFAGAAGWLARYLMREARIHRDAKPRIP